jgi:hypothetical protein
VPHILLLRDSGRELISIFWISAVNTDMFHIVISSLFITCLYFFCVLILGNILAVVKIVASNKNDTKNRLSNGD